MHKIGKLTINISPVMSGFVKHCYRSYVPSNKYGIFGAECWVTGHYDYHRDADYQMVKYMVGGEKKNIIYKRIRKQLFRDNYHQSVIINEVKYFICFLKAVFKYIKLLIEEKFK